MKQAFLVIGLSLFLFSCDRPEPGAMDNESLSRKLFDAVRDDAFTKSELLMPDKGTYRKIMKEAKGEDVSEEAFDALISTAKANFDSVRSMIDSWPDTKFAHAPTETGRQGTLQFSTTIVKFQSGSEFYKFSYTGFKYNGKWFYMGDIRWIAKEQNRAE